MGNLTDLAAKGCTRMGGPSNRASAKIVVVALIAFNSVSTGDVGYHSTIRFLGTSLINVRRHISLIDHLYTDRDGSTIMFLLRNAAL